MKDRVSKKGLTNSKIFGRPVLFECISCNSSYQAFSAIEENNIKIEICRKCHPFFTKKSYSETNFGKIEEFKRRLKKTEEISNKTNIKK